MLLRRLPATVVPVRKFVLPEKENPAGPETVVPVLNCITRDGVPRRKIQRPPDMAVPVLKLYCQRRKIQPAAGDRRSSFKNLSREGKSSRPLDMAVPVLQVVLSEKENPAGCRRPLFQFQVVLAEKEIQPAPTHGRSSTNVVLPEKENPWSDTPKEMNVTAWRKNSCKATGTLKSDTPLSYVNYLLPEFWSTLM